MIELDHIVSSQPTERQVEDPHGPHRGGEDHPGQGREDQPAQVCPEEDNAGAPASEIHLVRQPGVARGELERHEVPRGSGPEVEQLQVEPGRGGQQEGAQHRHNEAGQDQCPGGQRGGEEHAGETRQRLLC